MVGVADMTRADAHGRRLNLRAALSDAVRLTPHMWAGAWAPLLLTFGLVVLPGFAQLPGWLSLTLSGLLVLAGLVAAGAMARVGVAGGVTRARQLGLGPAGLQFQFAEARILGAALLNLLFLTMIGLVMGLVILAAFGTAELDVAAITARDWAAVGPSWKLALLAVVAAVALLIPLLLLVRLSLFAHATVGRGYMVSLNSMGIAYGSFWPLLVGVLLMAVPTLLTLGVVTIANLTGLICCLLMAGAVILVQGPLTFAFLGETYRQLEYWSPRDGAS